MDKWTREKRSEVMSKIHGVTKPEKSIRARLTRQGVRGFKVGVRVGHTTPDLIFPAEKVAVFVDGCFWHRCPRCYVPPQSRVEFWADKIARNVTRDRRQRAALRSAGWKVVRIWECRYKENPSTQVSRIIRALGGSRNTVSREIAENKNISNGRSKGEL